jgi:hypothetical protein
MECSLLSLQLSIIPVLLQWGTNLLHVQMFGFNLSGIYKLVLCLFFAEYFCVGSTDSSSLVFGGALSVSIVHLKLSVNFSNILEVAAELCARF